MEEQKKETQKHPLREGAFCGSLPRQQRKQTERRFRLFLIPVFLGTFFCLWYIHAASCDVIYSDYIRLIDAYLPDVGNLKKLLTPDVLTRIPASFLQRLLNVRLFSFSVTFDRLCGIFGLFLCGTALARYASERRMGFCVYLSVTALLFSLNKWEILLNGTAWAHVVSFGLFFWNYVLLDRIAQGTDPGFCPQQETAPQIIPPQTGFRLKEALQFQNGLRRRALLLCAFPFFLLLFAGEYIGAYSGTMLLCYGFLMIQEKNGGEKRRTKWRSREGRAEAGGAGKARSTGCSRFSLYLAGFLCTLAALFLYLLSRHFAVWEHAGATELSFFEAVPAEPWFLPRFFLKTFAGAVLGQETIASLLERGILGDGGVLLLGFLVLLSYLLAFLLYWKERLYQKSIFPLLLLLSGMANHVLVTASRWIFLREDYALSSRYGAQFMVGLIGILLTFGLWLRERKRDSYGLEEFLQGSVQIGQEKAAVEQRKLQGRSEGNRENPWNVRICKGILMGFCILFLAGNCYTTLEEIRKAPYREQNYEELSLTVRDYQSVPEELLRTRLEWNKSSETMYRALDILRENRLNVFRDTAF